MEIIHNTQRRRFEIDGEGPRAYLEYVPVEGGIDIVHTIVSPMLGGRGYGSRLVRSALDYARDNGLKVIPSCSVAYRKNAEKKTDGTRPRCASNRAYVVRAARCSRGKYDNTASARGAAG